MLSELLPDGSLTLGFHIPHSSSWSHSCLGCSQRWRRIPHGRGSRTNSPHLSPSMHPLEPLASLCGEHWRASIPLITKGKMLLGCISYSLPHPGLRIHPSEHESRLQILLVLGITKMWLIPLPQAFHKVGIVPLPLMKLCRRRGCSVSHYPYQHTRDCCKTKETPL